VEQLVENIVVREGDNVEVYCSVTAGIPDPTVMWTNVTTGEHIKGNTLNIANISRAQAGEYRCTANNTCGVESTVVDIDVQCKNIIRSFILRKFFQSADQSTKFVNVLSNTLRYLEWKPHSPSLFSCVSSFEVTWKIGNLKKNPLSKVRASKKTQPTSDTMTS